MKHEFALYYDFKERPVLGSTLSLRDEVLFHRLSNVLRVEKDDTFILFNRLFNVHATLQSYDKKKDVVLFVQKVTDNTPFTPFISAVIPILKREYLEEAIYGVTEMGVSGIQLVTTEKMHRTSLTPKDYERMHKIVIAAAEQSKHFSFPEIHKPISLQQWLEKNDGIKIFCDPAGEAPQTIFAKAHTAQKAIALCIGPEGDLSEAEKDMLKSNNVLFMHLTPTILRSYQAITLAVGMIRSLSNY